MDEIDFSPYIRPKGGFDPAAKRPVQWEGFLDDLWGDDQESRDALQEIIGYLITQDTSQQKIVLLVGPRRSGRGTIARVVTALLGQRNVAGPTLSSMSTNFGLQPLIDRPVAIIADARLDGRTGSAVTERLLAISGEDAVTIDRKYRTQWTGKLPTRLVVITNELPLLTDSSGALGSRFLVLKTTNSFLGQEDPRLSNKLLAELPGILLWALDGRDRLTQRGFFVQPASSEDVITDLEDITSPIGAFVKERCELDPTHTVLISDLYAEYRSWCEDNGRRPHRDWSLFVWHVCTACRGALPHRVPRRTRSRRSTVSVRHSPCASGSC